jgi:hypothetical protein
MTDQEVEIHLLKENVARLEICLAEMREEFRRTISSLMRFGDLYDTRLKVLNNEMTDAFESIKSIELKIFPNLPRDMVRIYDIIGEGEDKAYNPLDFRGRALKSRAKKKSR